MSMRPTSWLVALALLNAGCSLVSDGVHVISYRTQRALDDSREWHRDRRLAEAAWDEVGGRTPGLSADHADGFKEGFAAHLFRGTCEPPPLPPAQYRSVRNQNPAGYRAAEDWLNGFRHGVTEAQRRGLRDLVTGPSAFRTAPPEAVLISSDPQPQPEPVVPTAAVVPAASAPVPTVRAASASLPEPLPLSPPRRMTMQQFARTRLAIVTPVAEPVAVEPDPTPPRRTDEPAPRWSSGQPPDPEIVWRRSDG